MALACLLAISLSIASQYAYILYYRLRKLKAIEVIIIIYNTNITTSEEASTSLSNRSIKAKLLFWVILLLQRLQLGLAPGISSVPSSGWLVSISIVDIGAQSRVSAACQEDITHLIANFVGERIKGSINRGVGEERGNEQIVGTVGEGSSFVVQCLYTRLRVALEHEESLGEGSGCISGGLLEEVVHLLLGSSVV